MTAFEKYLLRDRAEGVRHLIECLRAPGAGELAWELVERFEGKGWAVSPEELPSFLAGVWDKLKAESESPPGGER